MNMKSSRLSCIFFTCLISLLTLSLIGEAEAQNLNDQMSAANLAWKQRKYDKSQAILERITTNYSGRAPMLYGAKFGTIWYRKGLSELKLANQAKRNNAGEDSDKWFGEAAKSFEECYKKYPNGAPGMAQSTNTAHKACLQRWAEASMGLGEYKKAIDLYKKFKAEREPRDKILPSLGGFYINLAICNFLMEKAKIPEGIRNFETALKNKDKMRTSDTGI